MNTADGPLVVVDRCVLSFRRVEEIVGANAQFVLTDAFFYEAATASPEAEGPKFNGWASRYADRLFLSTHWSEVSQQETQPGRCVNPRFIVREESTGFREAARTGDLDWSSFQGEEYDKDVEGREGYITQFEQLCSGFARQVQEAFPDWKQRAGSLETQHLTIRQPEFIASFVQEHNETKRGPQWHAALSVFPDRHAAGRWARLSAWYALQYSLGLTKDFRNNYHDAEYAFAASYVGRLATLDKRLIATIEAVFPDVQILTA